ncbi:MAG: methylmalonyl-CoA epimerase [Acidobacteria bacterium]|nr:methylmalonyl-CoA epimerase [Acidobacteriota bacterium]MCZ6649551.1 methylmalonyl-CoA epimerase [Acidobacteriota bacterium]MCZ6746259.1 methylmalonyl-CoA epimerase [Acidobacteriota bacterium]MCZ6833800.1 methylmalonyl-CoA epimerase [Acidobacteriota bacterium]
MSSRKQDVAPGRLDHIGVAVRSLEDALAPYKDGLGLIVSEIEEVPTEKVRVAFLPVGETRLELLEPTADDSTIARFLQRRGEGIHHLCFQVDDIEAVLKRLKKAGVELVDEKPRAGAGGSRVAFIHPRGMAGVLVELVEKEQV